MEDGRSLGAEVGGQCPESCANFPIIPSTIQASESGLSPLHHWLPSPCVHGFTPWQCRWRGRVVHFEGFSNSSSVPRMSTWDLQAEPHPPHPQALSCDSYYISTRNWRMEITMRKLLSFKFLLSMLVSELYLI